MDGRQIWTDCDEAGDYVVPNVLSPRDLVSRPDIIDETVPHTSKCQISLVVKYRYDHDSTIRSPAVLWGFCSTLS